MPAVASSGEGAPEVQMLFRSPTTPEPDLHSPSRPPMSPTPGTLHTPESSAVGARIAVSWVPVAGSAFSAVAVAAAGAAREPEVAAALGAAVAALAERARK